MRRPTTTRVVGLIRFKKERTYNMFRRKFIFLTLALIIFASSMAMVYSKIETFNGEDLFTTVLSAVTTEKEEFEDELLTGTTPVYEVDTEEKQMSVELH